MSFYSTARVSLKAWFRFIYLLAIYKSWQIVKYGRVSPDSCAARDLLLLLLRQSPPKEPSESPKNSLYVSPSFLSSSRSPFSHSFVSLLLQIINYCQQFLIEGVSIVVHARRHIANVLAPTSIKLFGHQYEREAKNQEKVG